MEVTTSERYASGPPGAEMVAPNLALAFQATVEKLGDANAIISGDETISWNEVREQARAYAGGFASIGVGKGDTVALMLNNRPEFMPIDLGAVTPRRGPVLDLPDLLAGADPVRLLRRQGARSRSSRRPSSTSSTRPRRTCPTSST